VTGGRKKTNRYCGQELRIYSHDLLIHGHVLFIPSFPYFS